MKGRQRKGEREREREVRYLMTYGFVLYWGEAKRPAKIKVCAMVSRER